MFQEHLYMNVCVPASRVFLVPKEKRQEILDDLSVVLHHSTVKKLLTKKLEEKTINPQDSDWIYQQWLLKRRKVIKGE